MTNTNATAHANPSIPVTAAHSEFIAKVQALRGKVFAHDVNMGAEFARLVSRNWKDGGCEGLRTACWILSKMCEARDVCPLAIYIEAKSLAWRS